jgi:hypothetical protein
MGREENRPSRSMLMVFGQLELVLLDGGPDLLGGQLGAAGA